MHNYYVFFFTSDTALFNTNNYYQASANTSEFSVNVYWLNNFNNIYQSYGRY